MEEYYKMSLITKARIVRDQAKTIIRDYEKHGSLDQETREDAFYCQGTLDILIDIVDTIHDVTITEEELNHLYNKLQDILFKEDN